MHPFRFAVQAMDLGDRDRIRTAAQQAESLGYEELYSYDHLGAVDPFLPLLVAAEATSTLRVGPLVLNNEFHHPVLLARTAATFDRMTGGRLVLGIGTGYAQQEHDAMDLELRPPASRVGRLGETLRALRSLLDDGSAEFDGEHHRLSVKELGVRPAAERVPFLLGGHGRKVVGLGAAHADIFQFTGLTHRADGTPEPSGFSIETIAERSRWLAEAAGDRDAAIERSVLVQATQVGDAAQARTEAIERLGLGPDVVDGTPFLLFGSVEEIVDKLERNRERIGVSHIVVRDPVAFAPVVAALAGG